MRITPCESWPRRLARTRSVATHAASSAGAPSLAKISRVMRSSVSTSSVGTDVTSQALIDYQEHVRRREGKERPGRAPSASADLERPLGRGFAGPHTIGDPHATVSAAREAEAGQRGDL